MEGTLRRGVSLFTVILSLALPVTNWGAPLRAQEDDGSTGRYRILLGYFTPEGGADKGWGKKVANELRKLLDDMDTHRAIPEKEVKKAAKKYDLKIDDLDCGTSRQLAREIGAQIVICGTFTEVNKRFTLRPQFWIVESAEEFHADEITAGKDDHKQVAAHVHEHFHTLVEQIKFVFLCETSYQYKNWEEALTSCNDAIKLNPSSVRSVFLRALVYKETEETGKALEGMKAVVAMDEYHEDALNWAGWLAGTLHRDEEARDFYSRYLELNPEDAAARMKIAYELATLGDPVGAMALIEEGFKYDSTNVDLHQQYGNFAFKAAQEARDNLGEAEALSLEVVDFYQKAVSAYERVYAAKGAEMRGTQVVNAIAALIQIQDLERAVSLAQKVVATHPGEAQAWVYYADALSKLGRLNEAIGALDKVLEADSTYSGPLAARQGKLLLEAGRLDDALPYLRSAEERKEVSSDDLAMMLLRHAHPLGQEEKKYVEAIAVLETAKEFSIGELARAQFDFWHGYFLLQHGRVLQEPETLESARRTLPIFQKSKLLLEASRPWAKDQSSFKISQMVQNAQLFIEVQDALIKRGRN